MRLRLAGEITVPGDKSITHRALMLAAAARGESRLRGLLPAGDCETTAAVLRALGVEIPPLPADAAELRIPSGGLSAWEEPRTPLDCGNSGTTARLLLGLLAGRAFCAVLTGDDSLRARPMRRVSDPLVAMGAHVRELGRADRLPLEICGGPLRPLSYRTPTASAQIKSALLLAGLSGGVPVTLIEPEPSRDHTERLLQGLGLHVATTNRESGWEVSVHPASGPLPPLDLDVPGDPSAAAFFVALALLADEGELCVRAVGTNPTRSGFLRVLARMGGFIELHEERMVGGEPVADLVIRPAALHGVEVGEREIPALIDEIPILAVLAARADGETRITGAGELRVKESDRIAVLIENLRGIGVEAEELDDGLVVQGTRRALVGRVRPRGDHRIAMAFGIIGALRGNRIVVDDPEVVRISFPGFWESLQAVVHSRPAATAAAGHRRRERIIIAIDGPSASGKSSTARAVAAKLGYRHLDSGAFYRALTWAALQAQLPPERWEELDTAALERFEVRASAAAGGYRLTVAGTDVTREMRSPEVNAHVSRMAALPAVRTWLLEQLRRAGEAGAMVADGRDLGTVVFPDAELKIFLVCAPEERALRRLREQGVAEPSPAEVRAETERLLRRDQLDSTRAVAPLLRAPDAVLLDTTGLAFDAQVRAIVRLAEARLGT